MRATLRAGIICTALLAVTVARAVADEPPVKKRNFIGSIAVPANQRSQLIAFLKSKGHLGAFVPEGAALHTLLYRGTKADYEAALDVANRYLHPEWYTPKTPAPKGKPMTAAERDAAENRKLGVSPLQEKLLAQLRMEGKRRWDAIQKAAVEKPTNLIEKGVEHNAWYRQQHRTILTREQYRIWTLASAAIDLGPEPKLPKVESGAAKSDTAIFAQLGLSEKQKEYLDHLQKDIRAGRLALALERDGRVITARRAELDRMWRAGVEHALTEKQLQAFRAYWNAK